MNPELERIRTEALGLAKQLKDLTAWLKDCARGLELLSYIHAKDPVMMSKIKAQMELLEEIAKYMSTQSK